MTTGLPFFILLVIIRIFSVGGFPARIAIPDFSGWYDLRMVLEPRWIRDENELGSLL